MELKQMREAMEKMEEERAEMMAEVEAQIERALQSMNADDIEVDESDYAGSRPASRASGAPRSRRASDAQAPPAGTDPALAESYKELKKEQTTEEKPKNQRRFSAALPDQDGMAAVDEGITDKSDKIAQKVLQIQRKVR